MQWLLMEGRASSALHITHSYATRARPAFTCPADRHYHHQRHAPCPATHSGALRPRPLRFHTRARIARIAFRTGFQHSAARECRGRCCVRPGHVLRQGEFDVVGHGAWALAGRWRVSRAEMAEGGGGGHKVHVVDGRPYKKHAPWLARGRTSLRGCLPRTAAQTRSQRGLLAKSWRAHASPEKRERRCACDADRAIVVKRVPCDAVVNREPFQIMQNNPRRRTKDRAPAAPIPTFPVIGV